MPDLRYPIGPFEPPPALSDAARRSLLADFAAAPALLRAAVDGLSPSQLDTPYRPQGWTVRQVIHHLPDSHLNWYVRTRLALTESRPTIQPFAENRWAELPDALHGPIQPSLLLLDFLHQRLVRLFATLHPADWSRLLDHPERGVLSLDDTLPSLAWHARHHTAQIAQLRRRMGW